MPDDRKCRLPEDQPDRIEKRENAEKQQAAIPHLRAQQVKGDPVRAKVKRTIPIAREAASPLSRAADSAGDAHARPNELAAGCLRTREALRCSLGDYRQMAARGKPIRAISTQYGRKFAERCEVEESCFAEVDLCAYLGKFIF
jgi:hypothetical protein